MTPATPATPAQPGAPAASVTTPAASGASPSAPAPADATAPGTVTSTAAPGPPTRASAVATTAEELRGNLEAVRARIDAAARRAGRDPAEIRLLPVSKTVPEERLRAAHAAGVTRVGENRVQEARRKAGNLADLGIRWVLIGHLQTNKVRDVVAFAEELQALDSLRLAEALDRRLRAAGRTMGVYVQVNSSGEASKSGLEPGQVADFLVALQSYPALRVQGLMTLAAHTTEESRVRGCFRLVRGLRDAALEAGTVGPGLLSMGMSGDLETAVEEGSTCVRVGQAIFGARPSPRAVTR